MKKTIEERIKEKITAHYGSDNFKLKNESHRHEGHAGHDGVGQSNFRLEIVSDKFQNTSKVNAQREVYKLLDKEFADGLHALSLKITTKNI